MKIGIVGLPNVGKSTLFKALTKKAVDINNYPFCTIEPNVGVVEVPDERLDKLSEMSKTQKIVPAVVEFVDIAGLVKGASEGEGLGNKFLANIREVDAILQVVRVFKNDTIIHVHNEIDPLGDIGVIETELALADLETVNKRIERLARDAKRGDKESVAKLAVNEKIKAALSSGKLANEIEFDMKDEMTKIAVTELSLLTIKPFLYVYNVSDLDEKLAPELEAKQHIKIDIKIEEELEQMTKEEIKELGLKTGLDELIKKSYELLGLITFLTTGEKETRAWTIKKGSTAPEAGTAIHNDFKNKFICADVIAWDELIQYGSMSKAKEAGKVKQVGKDYIMQDGEVVEFKIGG
ncbi:MAG: GTP-dependent nucleic acid-binding protein EngD [Candidatus Moranbacteria bacterium GW2011_GWF2_34_56]|nr:MAG: GTP-dependent nucleic acid-binding protein EngD [Candidatus Moranbacteria bacterium GW2011_GWF1_34_10]KKP64206.1 MAG: GTP-dependent nucleic acid-binding protein EngD [Candidatus Moranbacteria bacterium GW2011_GWF2_34_56]HBI17583.1 redox-regulated ATPase YchF [Candidatus Moranbacteria bacterium]